MARKFGWFDSGAFYEALDATRQGEEPQLEAGRLGIGSQRIDPHQDGAG